MSAGKVLLDAEAIDRTLSRIAHEIIERNDDLYDVALVGIHRRGVPLAQRLRRLIAERAGVARLERELPESVESRQHWLVTSASSDTSGSGARVPDGNFL